MKTMFYISAMAEKNFVTKFGDALPSLPEQDEQILDDLFENAEEIEELQKIPRNKRTDAEQRLLEDDKEVLENILGQRYDKGALVQYARKHYPTHWAKFQKDVTTTRKFFNTLLVDAIKKESVPLTEQELEDAILVAARELNVDFLKTLNEEDEIPELRLKSLLNQGAIDAVKEGQAVLHPELFVKMVKVVKIDESIVLEAIRSCLLVENIESADVIYKGVDLKALKSKAEKEIDDFKEYRLGILSDARKNEKEAGARKWNTNKEYVKTQPQQVTVYGKDLGKKKVFYSKDYLKNHPEKVEKK